MCVCVDGGGLCSTSDCSEVERCDDAISISLTVYFHLSLILCVCWVVSASFWFTGRWFLFLETVGSAQAWSDSTQSCLSLNGSRAVCLCTERAYIFWCELCAFFLVCVLKIVFCKHLNSVIPKGNFNWFNFYSAGVWTPVQTIRCGLALCVPSLKQSHLLSCHHIIRENGSCPPPHPRLYIISRNVLY